MNFRLRALSLTNAAKLSLYSIVLTLLASSSLAQPIAPTNDPAITQQPQSVTTSLGGTVSFAVRATGTQPLSYQWLLNGTNIPGATATNLVIANVQAADAGFYSVLVSNNVGVIVSSNALLRLPVTAAKGKYAGLFASPGSPRATTSGACVFSFSKGGLFTAKLQLGGRRYSGASMLDTFGGAQFTATSSSAVPPLTVAIQLAAGDANTLIGQVWSETFAPVPLLAQASPAKGLSPEFNGRFTIVLRPLQESTNAPAGSGCVAARIDSSGRIAFTGFMGDGARVAGSSRLTADAQWPFYFPLYHGKGLAFGWLAFTGFQSNIIAGTLFWAKSASTNTAHADGFAETNTVFGSRYVPPAKGERALDLPAATLLLQKNDLSQPITTEVHLDDKNKLTLPSSSSARPIGTINRATGLLKATIPDIDGLQNVLLRGIVLQNTNRIEGLFLNDNSAGFMSISGSD
jgi:hypothetical protein